MVTEGFPFVGGFSPENFDPWSSRQMNLSPDGGATPAPRTEGDVEAMRRRLRVGHVFDGDIDIPIIDWRHYLEDDLDMHHSHQSFATRQRIIDYDGDAGNQVIWFTDARPSTAFDQTPMAFAGDRRVDAQHQGDIPSAAWPRTDRPRRSTRASTRTAN